MNHGLSAILSPCFRQELRFTSAVYSRLHAQSSTSGVTPNFRLDHRDEGPQKQCESVS